MPPVNLPSDTRSPFVPGEEKRGEREEGELGVEGGEVWGEGGRGEEHSFPPAKERRVMDPVGKVSYD